MFKVGERVRIDLTGILRPTLNFSEFWHGREVTIVSLSQQSVDEYCVETIEITAGSTDRWTFHGRALKRISGLERMVDFMQRKFDQQRKGLE